MSASLLVLNAGSSSLKFSLFVRDGSAWPPLLAHGVVADIEQAPTLELHAAQGGPLALDPPLSLRASGHDAVLAALVPRLAELFGDHPLVAVGHRVVHGGGRTEACRVDASVLDELDALRPLAPLHQPHNLAPIAGWLQRDPTLPQFAAFDTAFHRSIAPARRAYPLPADLVRPGIERYGFHGLSYEYIARRLALRDGELAGGRCIVLHLGAGASACALLAGCSLGTSMGFTTLDGLTMATRCGSLDPGLVLHLLESLGLSPAELRHRLYHDSGLIALSAGLSGDMRTLLAAGTPAADAAIEHFCWRARREIGALTAELGGLDTLVFTGGIGEHAAAIRARIAAGLEFLGVRIDAEANGRNATALGAPDAAVELLRLPTDEEAMVAHHMEALLRQAEKADPT